MIPRDDIKAGNWISLKYPGSLIAAHRVSEVSEYGVLIENGKTNALIKVGNTWEYPEVPRKEVVGFRQIKGIPLTGEILESCGFRTNDKATLQVQPGTGYPIRIDYSDQYLFTLSYRKGTRNIFTHAGNLDIEFVHQLQNLYGNCMNRKLEISIGPFNFQFSSNL